MTRAQAESILVGRRRQILVLLGLSTAQDGTNPDLADPLARTVRQLGGTTADPAAPSDDEISAVTTEWGEDRLLDAAEIHLLSRIRGNWTEVSYTLDGRSEQLNQLFEALLKDSELLQKDYQAKYGADPGTPESVPAVSVGRLCPSPWEGRRPWPRPVGFDERFSW